MPKGRQGNGRPRFGRRALAAVLSVLPALVLAGVFAPGVVEVAAQERQAASSEPTRARVPFRPVRLSRVPLLVPRDYSTGFIPELLSPDRLFRRSPAAGDPDRRVARIGGPPRSDGDVILFDDVDPQFTTSLFKDALNPSFVADSSGLPPLPGFLALRSPIPPEDPFRTYDDLTGGGGDVFPSSGDDLPPPVVPEPGTGELLALGLAALAWSSRYRQPTTS